MGYLGRSPTPSPIDSSDIPANSIDASKIVDGSIELAEIADNSITDAKLNSSKLDGIETGATNYIHPTTHATADVADNAITEAKIADAAVVSLKSGRKNLIINGGMEVWQRATSTTTAGVGYRTADRFWTLISGGTGTFQRSTDVPAGEGFNYSMSCDATGVQYLGTSVELSATGKPGIFKANTDYTLSVWTKGTAGSMSLYFRNAIATGTDSTTVSSLALVTSAGWTKQSVTFNMGSIVPHANNTHLGIDISNITNGGKITGYQLEEGSVATDFEHRSYGEELALCQRYYELGFGFYNADGNYMREAVHFSVTKRTSPTIVQTSETPQGYGNQVSGSFYQGGTNKTGLTASNANLFSYRANLYSGQYAANQDVTWKYTADAEL